MSHKIDRTGESKILPNGLGATIITYRNNKDIDVQFSDGRIGRCLTYAHFVKGDISGTNRHYNVIKDERVGQTFLLNCGLNATVVRYGSSKDVDVELETGEIVNTRWSRLIIGEVIPKGFNSSYTQVKRAKEKWEGQTNIASNGMKITLVEYRSQDDIDVLFEDGYLAHTSIQFFTKGQITNPNYDIYEHQGSVHVGEETVNSQGLKMKILRYKRWADITVEFEDGTVVDTTYGQFKTGKIENPNAKRERRNIRAGEKNVVHNGLEVEIIDYRFAHDIDVRFETGEIVNTNYTSFIKGHVSHPTLSSRGKGRFLGFVTRAIPYTEGIFECECTKCGLKDIFTPHQMMEHEKICQSTTTRLKG